MAVATLFAAAHLPFLPPSLEDIDSINFALGLRHFDPALHQPHPPGYPVYIGLGHVSHSLLTWMAPGLPLPRLEALALAVWSILGGALAIVGAAMLFRAIGDRVSGEPARWPRRSVAGAAVLLALAPLFSISGVRPLSDMPGLALALFAQALIVRGFNRRPPLIWGALVAGIAAGVRAQTVVLTGPLLLVALVAQRGPHALRRSAAAVTAGGVACLAWAIPLVVLSGGWSGYARALQSQAGEDFTWVDMLWAHPTPRLLALALYRTLVLPWGEVALGVVVAGLAALGAVVAVWRAPRALGVLCLAFLPYAAFHLLLQETATIRYALPLLVPVVWLVTAAIGQAGRAAIPLGAALSISALAVSVPTAIDYGEQPHPAFRAIEDMVSEGEGLPPPAVYSHFALYRALQDAAPEWLHAVPPERQREWLGPVRFFRDGGDRTVWFLADPLRTDMALFDPASVHTGEPNPWRVYAHAEMGGARPTGAVWHRIQPPGWMVGEGWSLTPEAGGRVRATGTGLDHGAIDALVRRRPGPATYLVGGIHLGAATDAPVELVASLDGHVVDTWSLAPETAGRPFLRFVSLPDGIPPGSGRYATLRIAARALDPGRRLPEVAIRQFDLRSDDGRPLLGFGDGWYEDEFSPETGLRWRWTSTRAQLRLKASRTAVLRVRGESPVKYLGSAPTVRISAGAQPLATFHPASDFDWTVIVPADALREAGGVVTIDTDRTYLPGAAEGTADTRRLGLRIFECRADLQQIPASAD